MAQGGRIPFGTRRQLHYLNHETVLDNAHLEDTLTRKMLGPRPKKGMTKPSKNFLQSLGEGCTD